MSTAIKARRDISTYRDAMGRTCEREEIIVTIIDDHIRAIVERAHALGLLPTTEKSSEVHQGAPMSFANYPIKGWTDKPTAPTDDDSTIKAMVNAFITGLNASSKTYDGAVKKILEAIRRGEVPGLTTIDKCSHLINEHARAMNERDTLKAEIELLKTQYCVPGAMTIYANASEMTLSGVELKYRGGMDFDVINHPANELKAEVERLRAELAGAKVTVSVDGAIMKAAQIMEKERDAAIARAEELDRELGAHKASRIAYASEFDGDVGSIHQNIRAMKNDLGAAREAHAEVQAQVERLRAELKEANYWRHNYADSVKTVEAERDAAISCRKDAESLIECLRGEVEALKASRLYFKDAHAEAMGLLNKASVYCGEILESDIWEYLAKYGKDASK